MGQRSSQPVELLARSLPLRKDHFAWREYKIRQPAKLYRMLQLTDTIATFSEASQELLWTINLVIRGFWPRCCFHGIIGTKKTPLGIDFHGSDYYRKIHPAIHPPTIKSILCCRKGLWPSQLIYSDCGRPHALQQTVNVYVELSVYSAFRVVSVLWLCLR